MKVPAFLYGRFDDVKRRCSIVITQLRRGASWSEAIGTIDLLDTSDIPFTAGNPPSGLLVLDGPSPLLGDADHVHLFALPRAAGHDIGKGRLPDSTYRELARAWMESAWGVLVLSGQAGRGFPDDDQRPAFLRAVLRFWDDMVGEGKRYTSGSRGQFQSFWMIAPGVSYALARVGGFGNEKLRPDNSPEHMRGLVLEALAIHDGHVAG